MRPGECRRRDRGPRRRARRAGRGRRRARGPGRSPRPRVSMNSKLSALLTSTTEKPRSHAISASARVERRAGACRVPGARNTTGAAPGLEPIRVGQLAAGGGNRDAAPCRRRSPEARASRGARKASSSVCTAPVSSPSVRGGGGRRRPPRRGSASRRCARRRRDRSCSRRRARRLGIESTRSFQVST